MATRAESPPGWSVLVVRRTIRAPREDVFRAWIDPELLRQWLHGPNGSSPKAEVDARVGGEFRITMTSALGKLISILPGRGNSADMVGRYVEIDPPERLVFTMGWERFPTINMAIEATTVTVEFNEQNGATELVLTHERQPSRRIKSFHHYGWSGSLRNLDKLLVS
jgi:uncharacterized protein YndB with AHSA1/START domain